MSDAESQVTVSSVVSERLDRKIELIADLRGVTKSEYIASILEREVERDYEDLSEEDKVDILIERQESSDVDVEDFEEELEGNGKIETSVELFPVPHIERKRR